MKFEKISIKDGLSQVTVNTLNIDSKGYIWAGTQDGLNRYDGYNFKIYRPDFEKPDKSIINNTVISFYEDSKSNLWIGTIGGLSMYDRKHEKFFHWVNNPNDSNSIVANLITAITEDKYGNIWFLARNTVYRLTFDSINKTQLLNVNQNLKNKFVNNTGVNNIESDKDGNIWLQTRSNHILYIPAIETNKQSPNSFFIDFKIDNKFLQSSLNSKIFRADKAKNIWILFKNYLSKVEIKENNQILAQTHIISDVPDFSTIFRFYIDSKNNLILCTSSGLFVYQKNYKQQIVYQHDANNPNSVSQNIIYHFLEDDFGIIWLGTTQGLNKFDKRKTQFKHFAPQPLNNKWLTSEYIYSFSEDKKGNIWIGTMNRKGLYIYYPSSNTFKNITANNHPDSLSSNQIRNLIIDGDFVWIGTAGGGLCKYDMLKKKFKTYRNDRNNPNSLINNMIYKIIKHKNDLWIGTIAGLSKLNITTDSFENFRSSPEQSSKTLSFGEVRALFFDKSNTLWIGIRGSGLHKMIVNDKHVSFKKYLANAGDSTSLSSNEVFHIYEDSQGFLWLATFGGGINKFDSKKETFTRYTIKNGLAGNVTYGILPDDNNNLWISTNNGLSVFNLKTNKFKNYSIEDGLQSNEFNTNAFFIDSEKKMYFGGVNGYNVFHPKNIMIDTIPPKLIFTDLKIFNKSITPSKDGPIKESLLFAKEINLNYWDKEFTIEFAAIHYAAPLKIEYAYMIENYHTEWINICSRHFVSFSSFPPGEYILKVKAANSYGVWNQKGIEIKIIIKPPFWKTNLFYVSVIIFLIGLIAVYIKIREKKLQHEKQILEEKVKERTLKIKKQNDEILEKNEELQQQKEEIQAQADSLEDAYHEISLQKEEIEKNHKHITDSILYAKRIQNAVLHNSDTKFNSISDYFIFFKPRDIVSGDFYYFKQINNYTLIAAADCTGHGVPGAFMSMLGVALLNEIVLNKEITTASQVLNELRKQIKKSLQQTGQSGEQQDGLDIAFCAINNITLELNYAGANNPLFLIKSDENKSDTELIECFTLSKQPNPCTSRKIIVIDSNHQPVGIYINEQPFSEKRIQLKTGDVFYIFTDGFHSQFGSEKNEKFKLRRFKDLLENIYHLPMSEQKNILENRFEEWKFIHEQTDDVLVIGIKV